MSNIRKGVPGQRTALALMILVTAVLLVVAWHVEPAVYTPDEYHDDMNWCIIKGYEVASSGINQPVTCLKDGQPVAIPPHSINAPEHQQ